MMNESSESRPDWNRPKPEHIPRPTYFPMVLAGGIVLAAWGVVFSWVFIVTGLLLFVVGLAGWVRGVRDLRKGDA